MSGSVVADFVAEAIYEGVDGDEPAQVRVLLSEDRLVLAGEGGRTVIDLDAVFDVVVSKIPEDLGSFFDQSVLVAYATDGGKRTALIRGEHDRIDRFSLFLHKAILRGNVAEIKHPAREGGRVRDPTPRRVSVVPTEDALRLRGDDVDVTIALDDVVGITHERRTIDGAERPLLAVRHRREDEVVTTEIYHETPNQLNVIARHLRSEYYRASEILEEIGMSEREHRALVALYAGVAPDALDRVLTAEDGRDAEPIDVESLLASLVEKELLADPESGSLTHDGALVAIHRIEDVTE